MDKEEAIEQLNEQKMITVLRQNSLGSVILQHITFPRIGWFDKSQTTQGFFVIWWNPDKRDMQTLWIPCDNSHRLIIAPGHQIVNNSGLREHQMEKNKFHILRICVNPGIDRFDWGSLTWQFACLSITNKLLRWN